MSGSQNDEDILKVEDLTVTYRTVYGTLTSLNSVSLKVRRGESISIVGESGSGKSTLGLSIVRLLPPNAVYKGGKITLDGKDVLGLSNREVSHFRGSSAFMIFRIH